MSEITIKQGHLKPTSSKEVVIEDGDWEVSVWVHGGKIDIIVVNREDKTISIRDEDSGLSLLGHAAERTTAALSFKSGR